MSHLKTLCLLVLFALLTLAAVQRENGAQAQNGGPGDPLETRLALIDHYRGCLEEATGGDQVIETCDRSLKAADVFRGDDQMSGEISWVFEARIREGEAENLEALIGEMSDAAEATEPGTLRYAWMISEDGARGQVHERYRDSEAALAHLASFNEHFAERLMALIEPERMLVYGNPSAALKQELAGASPIYMHRAGGFER